MKRRSDRKLEWPTFGLILATYIIWFLSGIYLWPVYPIFAFGIMALLTALHSSLVHEALHGHPTRNGLVNEFLVTMSLGLTIPYRRYKELHLKHHCDERLTDPYDDPESFYISLWDYEVCPGWMRGLLDLNQTMLGRIILGPILSTIAFWISEAKQLRHKKIQLAWLFHAISSVPILVAIIFIFKMPLWLYFIAVIWPALAIIAMRTYAEHRWHESAEGRTIIVEKSPFAFLFLNNNLHIVHHKNPTTAWYDLPSLYKAQKAEWQAMNKGYFYKNYWQLFRQFSLRAKEPIIHPKWRR